MLKIAEDVLEVTHNSSNFLFCVNDKDGCVMLGGGGSLPLFYGTQLPHEVP